MDLNSIINDLKTERDRIGRAIAALLDEAAEAISPKTPRKNATSGTRRGKGLTAAGRRRLSEAMKARWAARRGKASAGPAKAAAAPKKRGGGLTSAGRKKLSEAMKRRWAERKRNAS